MLKVQGERRDNRRPQAIRSMRRQGPRAKMTCEALLAFQNWRGVSDTLRRFSRVSCKAGAALPQRVRSCSDTALAALTPRPYGGRNRRGTPASDMGG